MVLETGLNGAHMLITGGTRGIGKATVEGFLSEGANVSYCARKVTGDEFSALAAEHGARAVGTSVDVADEKALVAWVQKAAEDFGRIDTVIANASLMHFESTPETWLSSFQVDLMGVVHLVSAASPYLQESPNASIIITSSFMAREFFRSPPAPYSPLKAAQIQHVQELSHQLGPLGVRTNAISPGPITFPGGDWERYQSEAPEWVEETRMKTPLRRLGRPEEVANAAVWLASRLSSYVSGTNLLVDGGIHVGTHF